MGDRTWVQIVVLSEQAEITFEILKEFGHFASHDNMTTCMDIDTYTGSNGHELTEFLLYEINYANVDDETVSLLQKGIAHNVTWGSGSNYGEGCSYFHFDDNGLDSRIGLENNAEPRIDIRLVLEKINSSSLEDVKIFLEENLNYALEPSWDNQIELGRKYAETIKEPC